MPYIVRKVPGKDCYSVRNSQTGKVHAMCSTKPKAEAQVRLLSRLVATVNSLERTGRPAPRNK